MCNLEVSILYQIVKGRYYAGRLICAPWQVVA